MRRFSAKHGQIICKGLHWQKVPLAALVWLATLRLFRRNKRARIDVAVSAQIIFRKWLSSVSSCDSIHNNELLFFLTAVQMQGEDRNTEGRL